MGEFAGCDDLISKQPYIYQQSRGRGTFEKELNDIAVAHLGLKGGVRLAPFAVYLDNGPGTSGANAKKMIQLAQLVACIRTPWAAIGDWNVPRGESLQSLWA